MFVDRFVGSRPELAVSDAIAQIARLDFGSDHAPVLLPFAPVSRGNPFQALTYGALVDHNSRSVPAYTLANALEIARAAQDGPRVLVHLHWLNVVMQSAKDQAQARRLLDTFEAELDQLAAVDASLMWTVHNVMPHDARFPDLELELRRRVLEQADLVHVMSQRTRELVEPLFSLPAGRTFHVAHPAYTGVYPQWMSRSAARAELGLPEHATVFALFGRIAPYKGVTELVEAFDRLAAERPGEVYLVLAGDPVKDPETRALERTVAAHPAILAKFAKILDPEVQVFLSAADVMALPYRRSLNSGALNLALTFGLPVVLPRSSGEASTTDPAWAELYDDDAPEALLNALRSAADRLVAPEPRAAAVDAADRIPPSAVAEQFAQVVRHWADHGSVPEGRIA